MVRPLEVRFWEKVDRRGPDECWPWTAGRSHDGYGRVSVDGRLVYAPRVALMLAGRPLGAGQLACHTCDNPPCVNPAHLYVGTHHTNRLDAYQRGRLHLRAMPGAEVSAFFRVYWAEHPERHPQTAKTHCPQGHEYTPENTIRDKRGRHCRTCSRASNREAMRRRRAHGSIL